MVECVSAPAAFLGHGSPMNALDDNAYTRAWRAFGESLDRPRALVVVSAHWYINATAVTAMAQPRTIHDFYGFPDELFAVDYPAPGAPDVAELVAETVKPQWVGLDRESWGIDHGTWSVLVHARPAADIPVVQLSINASQPIEYHFDLGRRLAPLLEQNVAVIGSGNVVHNLRRIDWARTNEPADWNRRFNEAAIAQVLEAPADIARLTEHDDYAMAVPTPDHFLPLVYFAGVTAELGAGASVLIDGYAYSSLSMTSFATNCAPIASDGGAGVPADSHSEAPADQTNI